jgi:8-oxo-dGTP diphosphatase
MLTEDVKFCPRCGTELSKMVRWGVERPVCLSCDWVFFPDPKVAAAVLIQKNTKVLLVRRTNNPRRGYWTLPVGFVDAGEDPARAGERECLEETGLKIKITNLLEVYSGQEHPRGAHIIIVYQGEIIEGDIRAGDDVDQVGYFDVESLPPLAFKTTQTIISRFTSEDRGKL